MFIPIIYISIFLLTIATMSLFLCSLQPSSSSNNRIQIPKHSKCIRFHVLTRILYLWNSYCSRIRSISSLFVLFEYPTKYSSSLSPSSDPHPFEFRDWKESVLARLDSVTRSISEDRLEKSVSLKPPRISTLWYLGTGSTGS